MRAKEFKTIQLYITLIFIIILLSSFANAFSFKDLFKSKPKELIDASNATLTSSLQKIILEISTNIASLKKQISELTNLVNEQEKKISRLEESIVILNQSKLCSCNQSNDRVPTQPPINKTAILGLNQYISP